MAPSPLVCVAQHKHQVLYNATPHYIEPSQTVRRAIRGLVACHYPWPIQFLSRRTGALEVAATRPLRRRVA
jgi:hypothetical protein